MAPRPAIDSLMVEYNASPFPEIYARFGLPFAIVAFTQFKRVLLRPSTSMYQVQPIFKGQDLIGGDQITIRSARPSMAGYTRQFFTALTDGANAGDTVIGMMPETAYINVDFNGEFAGVQPFVPVSRVDISGFGESVYSDWRDPFAGVGQVSKAPFNASVGRCTKEVVLLVIPILPYGIKVIQTITIERLNNGTILRRNQSGWEAVSEGQYQMPPEWSKIKTHPGIVSGVSNIVNIRDIPSTDWTLTSAPGITMRAVTFDCSMQLEGIESGQGPAGVPALNQAGYFQLNPGNLEPAAYAELLGLVGPLGGLVGCVINIGGSGLRMRVVRVGVGATVPPTGDPQFAMTAWGTVGLPRVGQWSFIRTFTQTGTPEIIDGKLGVPLVREGIDRVSPLTTPYRFADPQDLLSQYPSADYGIIFSTGYQRVQFPRPKIEVDGKKWITSSLLPFMADVYS